MSTDNDDCWYVLESDTDDNPTADDEDAPKPTSGRAPHVYGAIPNSSASSSLSVNGVAVVSWKVDGEVGNPSTPDGGKSGIHRASLAMTQGVSGSSYDLRSAIGLVNRVVVSPRITISDRQASKLTEPSNARKPIKRNGQVGVWTRCDVRQV